MNVKTKPVVLAALLATSALMALAQPGIGAPGGPGAGPGMQQPDPQRRAQTHERMKEHMASRAAELKAKLKLTPEQESSWNSYVADLKPPAQPLLPKPDDVAKLSTLERLDKMRELRKQRDAQFDKRDAATRTFYSRLSSEQKKVFDDNTGRQFHEGRQWGQR